MRCGFSASAGGRLWVAARYIFCVSSSNRNTQPVCRFNSAATCASAACSARCMSASRLSAWAMALRMDSSRLRCSNICVSEGDGFWERRFDGFGMIRTPYALGHLSKRMAGRGAVPPPHLRRTTRERAGIKPAPTQTCLDTIWHFVYRIPIMLRRRGRCIPARYWRARSRGVRLRTLASGGRAAARAARPT